MADLKPKDFQGILVQKFPYVPTSSQEQTLMKLSTFVLSNANDRIFLLRGYAGTGKTTIIVNLVKQ